MPHGNKNQLMKFMNAHDDWQINDVKFSPLNRNLLVTSGQDGFFKIWDLRDKGYKCNLQCKSSTDDLNCSSFNNVNPNLLVAAGEQSGAISVWDLRMPQTSINTVTFHKGQVTCVEWHPTQEQVFVSGGDDGAVYIWDNAKNGEEQGRRDYEDGPPELVASNDEGHASMIEDVCWQPNAKAGVFPMIASIENERVLEVWKPKEDFFVDLIDDIAFVDKIAETDLE